MCLLIPFSFVNFGILSLVRIFNCANVGDVWNSLLQVLCSVISAPGMIDFSYSWHLFHSTIHSTGSLKLILSLLKSFSKSFSHLHSEPQLVCIEANLFAIFPFLKYFIVIGCKIWACLQRQIFHVDFQLFSVYLNRNLFILYISSSTGFHEFDISYVLNLFFLLFKHSLFFILYQGLKFNLS